MCFTFNKHKMRNTQLKKRSGSILGLLKIDMFFILVIFDRLTLNGQRRSVQPKKNYMYTWKVIFFKSKVRVFLLKVKLNIYFMAIIP